MLIFLALLYFCVACSLIWLACFPSGRASVLHFLGGLQRRAQFRLQLRAGELRKSGSTALRGAGPGLGRRLRGRSTNLRGWLRRHRAFVAVGLPLVLVPPLIALLLRRPDMLPGYEPLDTVV